MLEPLFASSASIVGKTLQLHVAEEFCLQYWLSSQKVALAHGRCYGGSSSLVPMLGYGRLGASLPKIVYFS